MRILILAILVSIFTLPASYAASPAPKKWTFIIFMNGNNNLDKFTYSNLKQMEKVGSTDDINVVVQWASMRAGKTVRLKIEKSSNPSSVTSPVIQDMGAVDMGDYQSLENFIIWSMTNYPAEHYFVDVWNHGSGWSLKRDAAIHKDISFDEISGHVITTEQLAKALDNAHIFIGRNIDIYGSDACLMAMAEVAKQVSQSTNFYVGSEALEPGDGWPYDAFLAHWTAKPEMTPQEITTTLVNDYVDYYKKADAWYGITLSAYDLSKIAPLESALAELGGVLRHLNSQGKKKFISATHETQKFDSPSSDYADLIDLMINIKSQKINGLDNQLLDAVITASQAFVIANNTSSEFRNSKGVAIWLPARYKDAIDNERANRYRQLPFDQDTQWADTMAYLLS